MALSTPLDARLELLDLLCNFSLLGFLVQILLLQLLALLHELSDLGLDVLGFVLLEDLLPFGDCETLFYKFISIIVILSIHIFVDLNFFILLLLFSSPL